MSICVCQQETTKHRIKQLKTARQSGKVTWWSMGRAAVTKYGKEKALTMASDIRNPGCKTLFLSGVNGEPRPLVRPEAE